MLAYLLFLLCVNLQMEEWFQQKLCVGSFTKMHSVFIYFRWIKQTLCVSLFNVLNVLIVGYICNWIIDLIRHFVLALWIYNYVFIIICSEEKADTVWYLNYCVDLKYIWLFNSNLMFHLFLFDCFYNIGLIQYLL